MKLQTAIECDATAITLANIDPTICPVLTAGGHALLTIYTAAGTERVIATKCAGSTLTVVRADNAHRWPASACVKLDDLVTDPLPDDGCCDENTLAGLTFGPEFEVTRNGCTMTVRLKATGVVAGDFCGYQVNEFGQVLDIPENWPAACLPVFNPCGPCDDTGTGAGATEAYAVGYSPQAGARVALGGNVQQVIEQIEDAVVLLQDDLATSVEQVMEGTGISITGLTDYPTVSLAATGVAAGTYVGFEVDQYGRVVSYTDPGAAEQTRVVGDAGAISVTADLSGPAPVYTVKAADAGTAQKGVVEITDIAEIQSNSVTDDSTVPNYGGVKAHVTREIGARLPPGLQELATIDSGDWVVVYHTGDGKLYQVSPATLAKNSNPVGGIYDALSGTISASKGVAGVTHTAVGVFRVSFQLGMGSVDYHVAPTVIGLVTAFTVVRIISATVFEVRFFNAAGVAVDPDGFSFSVHTFG